MLDQLGLGIVLTMKDDFTPQANKAVQSMNKFSSSADQMEKDVQKSMSNLQNTMLAGFSLNQVGGDFERAGKKLIGVFSGITNEIVNVNASYETKQAQLLTAFKGDAQEAKKAFDWIRDYAIVTPFQTEGLTDAFSKMKSTGMDLRKEFKTINGDVKTLAESIADLASRNMGATGGVSNLAYAVQNAWAGQARSLYQRFNFSKQEMDGMMQFSGGGATPDIDKFMEEFVHLSQRLAPDAMKNMEGTWAQITANMEESWSNFIYDIGQEGAFKPMLDTLNSVQKIFAQAIGNKEGVKNLANIFKDMWVPVNAVVVKLAEAGAKIAEFASLHPGITKAVAIFTAFAGSALIVSGVIMKLTGSFLILTTSIVSAYANLKILNTFDKVNIFSGLGIKVGNVTRGFGVFGLVVSSVALAFKHNVDGMRDRWERLSFSWKTSGDIFGMGIRDGMQKFELTYDKNVSSLINKMLRFKVISSTIFKTLFGKVDENGVLQYTQKELDDLRVMGLLPFAQTLAIIRGRVVRFAEGFSSGLTTIYKVTKNFLDFVLIPFKAIFETLSELAPIKAISSIFGIKNDSGLELDEATQQLAKFERLGEMAGKVVGTLLGFKVVKSLTSVITSPFKGLLGILEKTNGASKNLKENLGGVGYGLNPLKRGKSNKNKESGVGFSQLDENFNAVGDHDSFMGKATRGRMLFNSRKAKAKTKFTNFLDERSDLPEERFDKNVTPGYSRVKREHLPDRYRDYINTSDEDIYTKNQFKLKESLFGAKYFKKGSTGEMQGVGGFGGRLRQERDDNQLRLALESKGLNLRPTSKDLNTKYDGNLGKLLEDRANYPVTGSHVGGISHLKDNPYQKAMEESKFNLQSKVSTLKDDPKFRSEAYKDFGVSGRMFNGMDSMSDPKKKAQRMKFQEGILNKGAYNHPSIQEARMQYDNAKYNNYMGEFQPVMKSEKQSSISKALFGQRFYTPEQDENGKYSERTVARSGGIFRKQENDMKYIEKGNPLGSKVSGLANRFMGKEARSNMGEKVRQSMPGQVFGMLGRDLRGVGEEVGEGVGEVGSRFSQTMPGQVAGMIGRDVKGAGQGLWEGSKELAKVPLNYVNKQRGRLGMTSLNWLNQSEEGEDGKKPQGFLRGMGTRVFGSNTPGLERQGLLSKVGTGLFGRATKDEDGNQTAKGGLFSRMIGGAGRVVKGTGKVAGGIGRGIGAVGRGAGRLAGGAMRALPMVGAGLAVGKMGYDGIKNMGDGDFGAGAEILREKISSMDFTETFNGLLDSFKTVGGQLMPVVKEIFGKIGVAIPPLLGQAWEGLKVMGGIAFEFVGDKGREIFSSLVTNIVPVLGSIWENLKIGAGMAWEWITTDGLALLGGFAEGVMPVLGTIWENLKIGAGLAWEWITVDGMNMIGTLVGNVAEWLIGTGIPLLITSLLGLGKWIVSTAIPNLLKLMGTLAIDIGNGLLTGITGILGGLGRVLGRAVLGSLKGVIRLLLPKPIEDVVINALGLGSVDVHHEGLWMSDNEHPAIIRKDETVLPPDKSRRLDSLLDSVSNNSSNNIGTGNSDNSINIDKVEIIVQAENLSRPDARKQAQMILEEFKRLQKEKNIRQYN